MVLLALLASVTVVPLMLCTVEPSKVEPTPKPAGKVPEPRVTVGLLVLLAAIVTLPVLPPLPVDVYCSLCPTAAVALPARVTVLPLMLTTVDPSKVEPTPKPSGIAEELKITILLLAELDTTVMFPLVL